MAIGELQFARPVERGLVHKHAVGEVFVTDICSRSEGHSMVAGELPRTHCYYSDVDGLPVNREIMPLLELTRQACFVLAHSQHAAPGDWQFILRSLSIRLATAVMDADGRGPPRVVLLCSERDRWDRAGVTTGVEWQYELRSTADQHLGEATMSMSWLPRERWNAIRAEARRALELPEEVPMLRPPLSAVPAAIVGRESQRNVVLASLDERWGHELHATLCIDVFHPGLFDHWVDHIPGMVELEAARQISLRIASCVLQVPANRLSVKEVRAMDFTAVGELDLPTECVARIVERHKGTATLKVEAQLRQGERVLGVGLLEVAPAYHLLRNGRDALLDGAGA